ncbi:ABC transporter permease [Brevibacterium sp. 50QC2O2]|jgi:peptide/nickel transport system permease protein|uniref:ABC transporter permease n=1 Tax=unclassified Brevibacterium TaxID=2614124 RepID=UPI00211C9238|nr:MULTISPECIES: ABC transporter permease [unclassified Brevibacterium]MCQ9369228.1 ABC transporter permease [Brevibacterium sp. 91QC2O2]MCQ9387329.1 ABC transporter permease [Brevibacterium sp. 50QC2O2]
MLRFLSVRLLQFAITLVIASVVVFALLNLLPGSAAQVALGVNATPEAVAALEAEYGLDRPLPVQYLHWVGGILHGDFGTSYVTQAPVGPVISGSVQVTLILVVAAVVVSLLIAVPVGTLAAVSHRRPLGAVISALGQVGVAIPSFLAAILLVLVFSVNLGWLPSSGWVVPAVDPAGFLRSLILPVLALSLVQAAILSRYVRSAVLDVLGEDFLRTARAKGLTRGAAVVRHGLRNAAVPVLTVTGLQLSALLVGAVVVEQVFVLPGMGSELVRAVGNRDLVTVQGIVLVLVFMVLVINLLVDVLYTIIDPRIRRAA